MTLTEFLLARIADDEAMARAAIDKDRPGTHWHWVTRDTDTPVKTGELLEAQDYQAVSLRTIEEYPTRSGVGSLPAFVISHTEEVAGAGDHIARWDPHRVLLECEAKQQIITTHEVHCIGVHEWPISDREVSGDRKDRAGVDVGLYAALRLFALIWVDHPDSRLEWD